MSNINSSTLKLLYENNMSFWKRKCFILLILISTTFLGLLTFYAARDIFNRGKNLNTDNNLNRTLRSPLNVENLVISESSSTISNVAQPYYNSHVQKVSDNVHKQEISVTCELNNRLKNLMYEIKMLYNSLNRLDVQFNRGKRGLREETTIVDCVEMKGKFNKIYEDLNRISKALSMVDDNGICRCKCPLDTITTVGTTTEVSFTKIPFDQTTFTSGNLNEPATGENTKQSKKNIFSKYTPQSVTNQVSSVSDYEILTTTSNEENEFTTMLSSTLGGTTTQEDTDITIDTKGDLSPEMSIAVTNIINREDNSQTTIGPQIIYFTGIITNDSENIQTHITSDTSTSSTDIMDPNESIGTTELNNRITTAHENNSNRNDFSNFTAENENISESTTEMLGNEKNHSNTYYIIEKNSESSYENKNISKSTTDILSKPDNKYDITYFTEKSSESTSENENISGSTTEISELDINHSKKYYVTEKTSQSTSENENTSGSTTEISELDNDYSEMYGTEKTSEFTSKIENIPKSITETSKPDDNNYTNTNVTDRTVDLIFENKNIRESITENKNKNNTVLNERTSSEDRGEKHYDEPKDGQNTNHSTTTIGNTNTENVNHSVLDNKDDDDYDKSTIQQPKAIQQLKVQPKPYPICFYPAPCSPNVVNYQQINELQDASTNTIQYMAQSLSSYKRKPPVATVIQNDYPVLLICRTDVVCSVADFAGQPNRLHCMYSVNVNKNSENTSNQTLKNYYNSTKNAAAVTSVESGARNNGDILTGNLDCPSNTFPCMDNSVCVDTENWCDGRIHCNDASDESQCNCKQRIDKDKLCDGYYDCPSGEDELGCFGCNNETFSCGDWDIVLQRSSCFERQNRCDYIRNCPNGRDEDECTLLSRHLENPNQIFFISYSSGYLHHNWKGNWYPMCGNDQINMWAEKACTVESGEMSKPNKVQYMNELTTYNGPYINIVGNNQIILSNECKQQGIFVECEPEMCGIRSDLKFNKNIDPDRMRRSSYLESSSNTTSRFTRSKDPRVVGGIASNPGAWPWLIALYQDGIFHCGGVILSDQWVLTAAHCVNQYKKHFYEVQAGILRRFSFSPMEQSRIVTHAIIHTQYSRSTMENDLAVLRLDRSLEFNRWIRPVCLPDHKLSWIPFPGTMCTAVGWGATVEHGPDPDNMREVEVPILAECTHKSDIDGKEICAGYLSGGHDTCQGDSGGPLLCREPNNLNKWYVAGIVSHGEGCARPMEPGVYTRVALYMDWIFKATEENNLPQDRPLQHCPGIRCKTGKQCIPTKRQCDKYVDCMNAEDEQNCDYTGSQYNVNLYRSRNTDHSNLKYSKLKSAGQPLRDVNANFTITTPKLTPTTVASVRTNVTPLSKYDINSNLPDKDVVKVETTTSIIVVVKEKYNSNNITRLNDTVLNALSQLFDNQFKEKMFSCKRITQVVLYSHRCDGTVDCEDGTDEESCNCKTRLANMYNSSAICDGTMDCHNGADEADCVTSKCKADETTCGWPIKCIKKSAWCDGHVNCIDGSDEKYCVAITNGTTAVTSDATGRPTLRQSGMVAVNRNGVWRVRCINDDAVVKIAHDTCFSLGYSHSKQYAKRMSWNSALPLKMNKLKITDVCEGLFVICNGRKTVGEKRYHWHVDILVNGTLVQSGVLLKDSWVLVRRTGLNLKKSYATAVLGGSTYSIIWIKSPYEQIIRVDGIREVPGEDFDLLHLVSPATVSRGVAPLEVLPFQPSPWLNGTCYSIGYTNDHHNNKTEVALLRPDNGHCDDPNELCFTVTQIPRSCSNGKNMSHVTAVICESNYGLFLAAPSIQPDMNLCDRNVRIRLPMAECLMNKIAEIIDESVKTTPVPFCSGKRCELGECIPWERVCDGVPDCRDEQDETIKMCQERTEKCKTNDTLCICDVGSFRCANGKCVEKTAFCDGLNNCGDGTDEPKTCEKNTCVDYLKLTAPERLCDGRWDCLDKTDEEFANCPGYCNRTNVYHCQSSNKCISTELVCDGEEDCPESDDEAECIGLITPAGKKNEGVLAVRSYGHWHEQCITDDYTDVDYHSLCRALGFRHAVGIKKAVGTNVDFENFMVVQLNAGTDVIIRSATKDILQRRTDHACTATYVMCSST